MVSFNDDDLSRTTTHQWRRRTPILVAFLAFSFMAAAITVINRPEVVSLEASPASTLHQHRRLASTTAASSPRILYVVTTLNEYNSGTRNTVKGSDRFQETLIPVVADGVSSMVQAGYAVDIMLVCHFTLRPERLQLLKDAVPESVGVDVWNDATPLGYDTSKKEPPKLENRTLHLARQHRFVIKDKLLQYDIFLNFEDDMVIHAEHVLHFVRVTEELRRLEDAAPETLPSSASKLDEVYHGAMTKSQLRRMMPGFIRVEVLLEEEKYGAQTDTGPIPLDPSIPSVNATVCCAVQHTAPHRPAKPAADKLMLWETNILPLGIRNMPKQSWLDWVMLQRGPNQRNLAPEATIGDWWSNKNKKYYSKQGRPAPQEFKYINNQGGWMATQEQIWRWHTDICPGGFLPPYEGPHYNHDGLDMRNVEWYSGGMQLATVRHACNLQRIVLLDPEHFSKSLLYHSANNKQRQLAGKKESFTKANTLLAQLHTVKKDAMNDM